MVAGIAAAAAGRSGAGPEAEPLRECGVPAAQVVAAELDVRVDHEAIDQDVVGELGAGANLIAMRVEKLAQCRRLDAADGFESHPGVGHDACGVSRRHARGATRGGRSA